MISSAALGIDAETVTAHLAPEAEPDARSVTASLVGRTAQEGISYSFEVLDSAADLEWIVQSDGLREIGDQVYAGAVGEAAEIVGTVDRVKFAVTLLEPLPDADLAEIVDSISFEEVGGD
jgi:hypothetical protein